MGFYRAIVRDLCACFRLYYTYSSLEELNTSTFANLVSRLKRFVRRMKETRKLKIKFKFEFIIVTWISKKMFHLIFFFILS